MDADTPVAHKRLMDEVVIFGEQKMPQRRIRTLYPIYALLGISYVFILTLCIMSFSREMKAPGPPSSNETIRELADMKNSVQAVSSKVEAMKSSFRDDLEQLRLRAQDTSRRVDSFGSDLSSLKSAAQNTSSRVDAIVSDFSFLKSAAQDSLEAIRSDLSSLKSAVQAASSVHDLKDEMKQIQSQVSALSSQLMEVKRDLQKAIKDHCGPLYEDWKQLGDRCYLFSKKKLNWMDAKAMCEAKNTTLVVITSAEEQNFLSRKAENEQYWIGLTDVNKEGEWKWIDATDYNASYKMWSEGEPNDAGQKEDCANIWTNGKWNDIHCTFLSYAICEKAALFL